MRASCSIIIPGRVTSTSATSAIGASTRIAAMRRRHGLPRRPAGFSAGGAPELSVSGRSRMARSAGWSRLCGVLCQRRASGPRRPSASGRTRSRAFAAARAGCHYPRFGWREQRVRYRGVPVCSPYPGRRGGAPVVRLRLLSHRDQHACLAALSAIGLRPAHLAPRLLASGINFEESWHARFDSRDLLPTAEGSFEIFNREGEPK